jgi:hypothetical protein
MSERQPSERHPPRAMTPERLTPSPATRTLQSPMRRWVPLLLSLWVGCSKQLAPLDASVLKARNVRTIGVVATPMPDFLVQRQGAPIVAMTFGFVVAMAALEKDGPAVAPALGVTSGAKRGNRVVDPSSVIATRLAGVLASKYGLVMQTPKSRFVGADVRWDTDFIVQVTTTQWGMSDSSVDWSHYRAYYAGALEVRDGRDGQLIVSGECTMPVFMASSGGAPTYDQMMAGKAALLKKQLSVEVDSCAQELSRKFLGIRLPDDRTPEDTCHLYGTPAWQAADAAEKQRMLHDCWDRRDREAKTPTPAGTPDAPASAPANEPTSPPSPTVAPSDGPR